MALSKNNRLHVYLQACGIHFPSKSVRERSSMASLGRKENAYLGLDALRMKTPFLIGVAGGTASGKSTVCRKIVEKLDQDSIIDSQRQVISVSQESFYKELAEEEKSLAYKGMYNFDHPDAFDNELIISVLKDILQEKVVSIPLYDFVSHSRKKDEWLTIHPADVVLFEGILIFYFQEMRDLFHMKLFVDSDSDTRLSRRVLRDTTERGRELEQVLQQYTMFVKPAFEEFCLPTKKYADIVIPRGADNEVAIDLIVKHIEELLKHSPNGFHRCRHCRPDSFTTTDSSRNGHSSDA